MKLFGICYVVFGLMALTGTVLDADGAMAAIREQLSWQLKHKR